ncbi:alpha/beta hydrolase [Nonomuraea sp. PA05]|uniref:alpha/beta hydrolase n=1 Tax=Nonomuraea sp. PA05 TaxID=2604466 RepID=UPI0011DC236F|nr:alpha/beta hydrolase [Nonomuraea sp. PA05]TYB64271.1 alpha/beta hydrolase [Nonomuraea sp. PA05]
MRRLIAALALAVAVLVVPASPAGAAPAWVSSYELQIGADPATVYLPPGRTELPVALLLQGGNVPRESYGRFARTVAGFGFAVAVPDHRRAVGPVSGLYPESAQLAATVTWAAQENTRAGSPLAGRLDADRLVLLGHSFGAAAGLFAAGNACVPPFCFGPVYQRPAALRAAAFYGAATATQGGPVVPVANAGVPVALVQGEVDGVNPPAAARATYDGLSSPPKAYVTVHGANHYGVTDTQTPAGALPDPSAQTVTQDASIDATARWSALFLRASLGDALAAAYVYGFGDGSDDSVTVVSVRGT